MCTSGRRNHSASMTIISALLPGHTSDYSQTTQAMGQAQYISGVGMGMSLIFLSGTVFSCVELEGQFHLPLAQQRTYDAFGVYNGSIQSGISSNTTIYESGSMSVNVNGSTSREYIPGRIPVPCASFVSPTAGIHKNLRRSIMDHWQLIQVLCQYPQSQVNMEDLVAPLRIIGGPILTRPIRDIVRTASRLFPRESLTSLHRHRRFCVSSLRSFPT